MGAPWYTDRVAGTQVILATRTTTRLLDALKEPANEPVWAQMDARYRPVIAGLARRLGLNESDADETAQQSLVEFLCAYRDGRYDRSKGRLSSWILGIARNTALRLRKRRDAGRGGDDDAVSDLPDEVALRPIWDEERDRAIIARALAQLRDQSAVDDRTLLAFELVALRGVPAAEVGQQCGMTVDQVYVAKSRLTKSLKELVKQMTEAFEEDA